MMAEVAVGDEVPSGGATELSSPTRETPSERAPSEDGDTPMRMLTKAGSVTLVDWNRGARPTEAVLLVLILALVWSSAAGGCDQPCIAGSPSGDGEPSSATPSTAG